MIFDEKKNLGFYRNLGIKGRYAKAVDFLMNTDLAGLEPGRYEIDGTDVVANVHEYTTVSWEEAKYEAHEAFTDIQYIIKGSEVMTYAPTHEMTVETPYNSEKDVVFYQDNMSGLRMTVKEGQYAIFFPWDAHKPKAADGQPAYTKKIVIKIKETE